MVRRVMTSTLLLMSVVLAGGCKGEGNADNEDSAESPGRVAVIDFQEIISGVGKQEEVEQQVQEVAGAYQDRIEELQQELTDLSAELEGQSVEGNEEKIQRYRQLEQQVRAVAAEGRERINATRQQLYNEFGEQLKPIARRVAARHGFSVILSDQVTFYSTGEVDITNEVLDELQEMMKTGEYKPSVPEARTTPAEG